MSEDGGGKTTNLTIGVKPMSFCQFGDASADHSGSTSDITKDRSGVNARKLHCVADQNDAASRSHCIEK